MKWSGNCLHNFEALGACLQLTALLVAISRSPGYSQGRVYINEVNLAYPDISNSIGEVGCASESHDQVVVAPCHQTFDIGLWTAHQLEMVQLEQLQSGVLRQLQHRPPLQPHCWHQSPISSGPDCRLYDVEKVSLGEACKGQEGASCGASATKEPETDVTS